MRLFIFVILCRPHLMLPDFGDNARLTFRHFIDFFNHIRTAQARIRIFQRIFFCIFPYMGQPCIVFHRMQPTVQFFQYVLNVSDYRNIHQNIFVDLRRIDIDLQNLCLLCKFRCISGHAVGKTHADRDQKIAFTDAQIGRFCSVHAQHSGIFFIRSVKRAFAHQRITYGRLYLFHKRF